MQKLNHYGNWIVIVPVVAGTVAFVALVYLPTRQKINDLREQAIEKEDFVQQTDSMAAVFAATTDSLNQAKQYVDHWQIHSPDRAGLYKLFSRINELAKQSGTVTTRFDPKPVIKYDTLQRIPLELGCTGDFEQIYRFLAELEKLPQEIWIEQADLRKEGGLEGDVSCEIRLAIFIDNPEKTSQAESAG